MKITLLGAGAWGTALAIAFAGKHAVTLWSRETDVAEDLRLNRENHRFFPGYRLPDAVVVSTDFAAAVADAELLVVATPIAGLRPTVEHLKALGCKTPVLWVCKGFEAGSGKLPHQVVGEGLKGTDYREIEVNGAYCKAPKIGSAIADADIIVSMTHFKGHEQAGFGGVLKNLGMGCASRGGKMELHAASQPQIDTEQCTGCNICVKNCAHDAIHLNSTRKAEIDYAKCVGCGQCVALCQYDGAVMGAGDTSENMNCKIAEYTQAVLKDKPHFHVSFIMNVSPECDCWHTNDAAVIPDLGIAASFDPVALDKACVDMVTNAPILPNNRLADKHPHEHLEGEDKFHHMHPDTNWRAGLEHAEKLGIGTMQYELITV
jgi:uncharacterized Fe-S center protein